MTMHRFNPGSLEHLFSAVGGHLSAAGDFNLPRDWLNATVGAQWRTGLPPNTDEDVEWREFGGLRVGLAGRQTLINLKLFAAVDHGPDSVHVQDLLALAPADEELEQAREWVVGQDAGPEFPAMVAEVITYVSSR